MALPLGIHTTDRGDFWASPVEIRVFASPTGYMFTSSGFPLLKLVYILYIPLKWSVIILQSWTSTGYISNSTGSLVINCRFSPIIDTYGLSSSAHDLIENVLIRGICGSYVVTLGSESNTCIWVIHGARDGRQERTSKWHVLRRDWTECYKTSSWGQRLTQLRGHLWWLGEERESSPDLLWLLHLIFDSKRLGWTNFTAHKMVVRKVVGIMWSLFVIKHLY